MVAGFGGFLLNFTPCVLPVVPLKAMGLSQAAGGWSRGVFLGGVMSFGVVFFWMVMGFLVSGISGVTAVNQFFQYPWVTIGVGVVIALMGLGMCGLFTSALPRWVYQFDPGYESVGGALGLGVMTAVLSTPCTAPFMGAAAAWAVTQPVGTTLTTFGAIGVGMALPYFVLAAVPRLVRWMPRTGPASVLIKQVMGMLILAASAYFIGVGVTAWMGTDDESLSLAYWWPVMAMIAAAGAWLAYRVTRIVSSALNRVVWVGFGVVVMAGAVYGGVRLMDAGPIDWVQYTPERFEAAIREGEVVVMDFTAEWCLNCKWLEKNVLSVQAVVDELSRDDVLAMKVDLTSDNEVGRAKLREVGRLTIPLLVVYSRTGEVVLMSDFYTVEQVIQAIREARHMEAVVAPPR
jgi:thiol:disulfide interchange protein DsbD